MAAGERRNTSPTQDAFLGPAVFARNPLREVRMRHATAICAAVAMGFAAMLLGAPAASAVLVFTWSGDCMAGCPAGEKARAELRLADTYDFGTEITNDNFDEFIFQSSILNRIITTLDEPTAGILSNGQLAGISIRFKDGDKVFLEFFSPLNGLVWAADPGGLKGLGDNFKPAGVFTVPEPSTWAMMLIGLAGLGLAAHGRSLRVRGF
jgi:hypothetical protein